MRTRSSNCGKSAIGQEAEDTDARESLGEQMQQEAAQKLIERKGQQARFVVVGGIALTKGDLPVSKRDQAMIGDGHAMGAAAQKMDHMLWASEGTIQVHYPAPSAQCSQPCSKGFRLSDALHVSMKVELTVMKGRSSPAS